MAAFDTKTGLYNYFRRKAQELNCNPCFDSKQAELEEMNEKGANGVPGCLCRMNTPCPCKGVVKEIERDESCYCEIFRVK